MIRCKLVEYVSPDVTQSLTRVGRAVAGEALTLGRAAACKIYLPDPRVRMEHAVIQQAEDGHLYLDAQGPVLLNGRAQMRVRLALGQQLSVGPYEFVVEALTDGPGLAQAQLTLSFAQRASAVPAGDDAATLPHGGIVPGLLTRRRLSWLFALLVLVLCAAVPVWHAYDLKSTLGPIWQGDGVLAQARVWTFVKFGALDTFWNPGTASNAHAGFMQECATCHDTPFARVSDTACTACHTRTGPHARDAALNLAVYAGQRCASCHKEHQGEQGMRTVDAIGCERCHGAVRDHVPASTLRNVSDFARNHPPFMLTMRTDAAPDAVQRVAQHSGLRQPTGLRFPHDLHLASAGIKSPSGPRDTGGRVTLQCADCHRSDATGNGFEPVSMARDCQGCHRLSVDAQIPDRQVPHGTPEMVATAVREIYASLAVDRVPARVVTVNTLLQRPQAEAPPTQVLPAGRFVQDRSRDTLGAMFERPAGVCTTCHAIDKDPGRTGSTGWRVAAVPQTLDWLPRSGFSHAQHRDASCTGCHDAKHSKQASDVLIPDIQACQSCHAGRRTEDNKVVSRCDSCHVFHQKLPHPTMLKAASAGAPAKRP